MSETGIQGEPEGRYAQAGEIRLHYHDLGRGPVVVCLHGGGPGASGWSNFKQNFAALTPHYRLLVVDMPTWGKSDMPRIQGGRLTYNARALAAFLDTLGVARAHFIGNSLGAQSAIKFAIDHPERIDRLVALGNTAMPHSVFQPSPPEGIRVIGEYYRADGGPSRQKMRQLITLLVYDKSHVTDAIVEERYLASVEPKALELWTKHHVPGEDISAELGKVKARTLLLWGAEDRFSPLDSGLAEVKRFHDAELHIFSKCGHWAQLERAAEFNAYVLEFLARP